MAGRRPNPSRVELENAIEVADRDAIRRAAWAFVDGIRTSGASITMQDGEAVLSALRGVREFALMQRVADVLIQSGRGSLRVRRQYAQSLLDQGGITAAITILQKLAADSGEKNRREHNEAMGLLGRAYKQLYVDAGGGKASWVKSALKESVRHYYVVYANDKRNLWHGINAAAMLRRAERDGFRLSGYSSADELAGEILSAVARKRKPSTWDLATAAEACVALGRDDEALRWVCRYLLDKGISAFHLGSFERQLREVWNLDPTRSPGSLMVPLIRRDLLHREGATVDVSFDEVDAALRRVEVDDGNLEKILGDTGVRSCGWWRTGLERARSVARIGLDVDRGVGTGFLVRGSDLAPELSDELVLATNAHVVSDDRGVDAYRSDEVLITFEILDDRRDVFTVERVLYSSPPGELDVTVLKLDKPVIGVEPCPLHPRLPTPGRSRVYVIGHPQGGTLSFSIQDNQFVAHRPPRLHYRAPTEPGSSGSPVFNEQWKLIGIHHAGGSRMRRLDGEGFYAVNEGIWCESVREAVQSERRG